MRIHITSALLFSITAVLWCQPSGIQEAGQYQNRAASLLLNGDFEGAIGQLEAAATLYKGVEEWEYYFSCLNQVTNAYLSVGEMDAAKRTAKKALWESIQRLGRDNDEAAKAAHRLAEVYSRAGRHTKAIEVHKMGLMIRESIYGERHTRLADSYDWLAKAWAAAAQYDKAAGYYKRAMALRKELLGTQHPDIAISYFNLASLELAREEYQQAFAHYQTAYNISRNRLGEKHPDVAGALAAMARIHRQLGDQEQAARQYREAALLYRQNPDVHGELAAESFYELARQYFEKGAINAAQPLAKAAIQALPPGLADGRERQGLYHQLNGMALMEMGRYKAAAGSFQQALASESLALSTGYYYQWCEALRLSGNLPEAMDAAYTFLEWAEEKEDRYALLSARTQLGSLLIENGQVEEGVQQLAWVLNQANAPFWLLQEASHSLGKAYQLQGAYEQAIRQYRQLATEWEQSRQAGAAFFRFRALLSLGVIHSKLARQDRNTLYNLEAALDAFHTCDKMLTGLLRTPLPTEQLAFLFEGQILLYSNATGACYGLYQQNQESRYIDEAFYFSERSKQLESRLPLLLLPATRFAQAPRSLLEREAECKMDVQLLFRALKSTRFEEETADSIQHEIEKREIAYRDVLAELEQQGPHYFQMRFGTEVAKPEAVSSFLQQQEPAALYSYFLSEEHLYIFCSFGAGLQLFRWPVDEALRSNLYSLLEMVFNEPQQEAAYQPLAASAVELYQKLLPAGPGAAGGRIFLLPHGMLEWFPFEALLPEAPADANFAALPYLGMSHELAYHSSASSLLRMEKARPAQAYGSPFEAFIFGGANNQVALKGSYMLKNGPSSSLEAFLELARREAAGNGGHVLEGRMASERVFRGLPPTEVLLLALYAQAGSSPGDTFISFSGQPDSLIDNRLYLKEIYGIHKPVGMYILPALLSPWPPEQTGWLRLVEALHYSGSRSAVLHRWPAVNRHSAELLGLFLSRWQSNGDPFGSLRAARQEYLSAQVGTPDRAHPHFWAGYVAHGPPAEHRRFAGIPGLWIVAAVAGLILIGWLVRLN